MSELVIVPTAILTGALDLVKAFDCYLKLFVNNYTPAADMEPADFTEAGGGGYAHKAVAGDESTSDWTEEYANTPPDIILAEQTYTFTGALAGGATIYGWYLVKQDLSAVFAAKKLDTPYTPASGGGTLKFTPRVQAGNGTPA
jgi:hypothetical protein